MGDNPYERSFVVGFGNNPPQQPHHRNAQGHAMEVVRDGVASRTPALAADALSVLRRSRAAKIVTSARTRP